MADQTATLAVGIDSTGAQAGAQVFVRSAAEIKASAEATGQSVGTLTAATQRFNLSTTEGLAARNAWFASLDRSVAAQRALTAETMISTEQFAVSNAAYAAAGAGAINTGHAMGVVAGETEKAASMFQSAGTGAGRLNQSLRTMELQLIGVQGAAGRSVATFGAFELGSAPLLAIGAAIIVVVKAYEYLTAAETAHRAAEQAVADEMDKSAEKYREMIDPVGTLTAKLDLLKTTQRELMTSASGPTAGLAWWQTIISALAPATEMWFVGQNLVKVGKDLHANIGQQQEGMRRLIAYWTEHFKTIDDGNKKTHDDAVKAAEERLRNIETVAAAEGATQVAYLKFTGAKQSVLQAEYDLALLRNASEAALATVAGKMSATEIERLQTAKDNLATINLQEATYKRINDLIKVTPSVSSTSGNVGDPLFNAYMAVIDARNKPFNIAPIPLPLAEENATKVSEIYRKLANEVGQAFTATFDNIFKNGITSLSQMIGTFTSLFEKMLSTLAGKALEADIFGSLGGTKKGSAPIDPSTGLASSAGAAGAVAGLSTGTLAIIAGVGTAVGLLVSSFFGVSQAAKDAAAANAAVAKATADAAAATVVFNTSLANYLTTLANAGSIVGGTLAQIDKQSRDFVAQAEKASPGWEKYAQLSRDAIAKLLGGVNDILPPALRQFLQAILDGRDAIDKAIDAFRRSFVDRIGTDFTASLGVVGTQINALTALATKRAQDLADATRLGLGDGTLAQIGNTYINNAKTFLAGLTTAQLDTLIPSLTGEILTWAQAIDVTKHAVDAATKAVTDAAAATAAKTVADQAAAAVAAAAAAAEVKRMADLATSHTFSLALMTREAALSGDAEQVRYARLATLQETQRVELANAVVLLNNGTITMTQYDRLSKLLQGEWTSAVTSFDGTIGGVTIAVHKLAIEAGILANNANQIAQQAHVFGDTPATQLANYQKIYGYLGQSLDSARALYTRITAGVDLTPAQSAMNGIIDRFVTLYEAANPVITTAAATIAAATGITVPNLSGATTATYGNSTPIIGPNGTFNITVNVTTQDGQNPAQVGQEIFHALQAELGRRANLLGDAAGRQ